MLPCFTRKPVDHPLGFVVAISGMLMQLMSYGIDNSYSIFSEDMHNDASLGNPSFTSISFGNSVLLGLSPAFGVFAGFLVDRLPTSVMIAASTVFLFAGLWLSSTFATNITAVTLSYCLLASVSSACMLSPGAAATSTWFNKYRGLAMGINFCGGGLGSAIIPSIVGKLVVKYGWRKTFRLMSAFCCIGVFATLLSAKRNSDGDDANSKDNNDSNGNNSNQNSNHKLLSVAGSSGNKGFDVGQQPLDDEDNNKTDTEMKEKEEEKEHNEKKHEQDGEESRCVKKAVAEEESEARCSVYTRELTPLELFLSLFTRAFMGNFFCWVMFGFAFFSHMYMFVLYISSMGKAGTVYWREKPIPTDIASTVFIFYGVFQIVGSVLVGWLATSTTDEFAYVLCAVVGGLSCAIFAFCRSYIAFAFILCIIGFCMAGMFAVMPVLIAKRLSGPHLGFYMATVFLAGIIGGFSGPPIQAELQQRNYGNYSYSCIFVSICMIAAGAICYITMWDNKRIRCFAYLCDGADLKKNKEHERKLNRL